MTIFYTLENHTCIRQIFMATRGQYVYVSTPQALWNLMNTVLYLEQIFILGPELLANKMRWNSCNSIGTGGEECGTPKISESCARHMDLFIALMYMRILT
jgi:hypothetical protein